MGSAVGTLKPNEVATYSATYILTQDDINEGSVFNKATASGTPPAGEPVTSDDTDTQDLDANPLIQKPLSQECIELVERGLVDGALILTGVMTGVEPDINVVKQIPHLKEDLPSMPIFLGSGVDLLNVQRMLDLSDSKVDGFIIGTAFKEDNDIHEKVDKTKVKDFMGFINGLS